MAARRNAEHTLEHRREPAARQSFLDGYLRHLDRPDHVIGVRRARRLRAGTRPGPRRAGVGISGISGIGAAGLGQLADPYGSVWVYKFCAYLPLLGLATILLPRSDAHQRII